MLQSYQHTFRAGAAPGITEPTSVLFYTEGRNATRHAAERIARGMAGFLGCSLDANAPDFIKARLLRLDRVWQSDLDKAHGLTSYTGPGCGGCTKVAIRCP